MGDETLKAAFQSATQPRDDERRDCPSTSDLSRLAESDVDDETRRNLIDHISECSSCAIEFQIAEDLHELTQDNAAPIGTIQLSRWTWALTAAALLIIGFSLSFMRTLTPSTPSGERQATDASIRSLIDETDPLARDAFLLRWSASRDDLTYDVQLVNSDLETLYEAVRIEATELLVPRSALESVSSGERLLWQVDAVFPDRSRVASPTFFATLE